MPYWFDGGHMVWMALWWLLGIGFFLLLIWLLVGVVRPTSMPESPETVLRRRYAAGEIDTEEFERRLEVLRKTRDAA
jgi:putative membrane protein